jgi:anti-anti-sigma factor
VDDEYYAITTDVADDGAGRAHTVRARLTGEFDLGARDELRDRLLDIIGSLGPDLVIVDLDEVTFIDSEAVGAIIAGRLAAVEAGIDLRVTNAKGIVLRIFRTIDVPGLLEPAALSGAGPSAPPAGGSSRPPA